MEVGLDDVDSSSGDGVDHQDDLDVIALAQDDDLVGRSREKSLEWSGTTDVGTVAVVAAAVAEQQPLLQNEQTLCSVTTFDLGSETLQTMDGESGYLDADAGK